MKTVNYEVVKMNVDTDMQYAFTKVYDSRSYLTLAETAMAERVKQAASDLRARGNTMFAQ